jgi:phosphocarrier protein HPr
MTTLFPPTEKAMPSAEVVVTNKLGLHARPSAKLTATAGRFRAEVWLSRNGKRVNAKSIMGVMMLAAARGSTLVVEAEGADASQAIAAIVELISSGFGEE